MQNAIDFVKDNPEVFAALVAAIGILGGIAGNWISAAVQAAGGRAQANAAVDAARISAEAQRLAALREDRKAQLAVFIRCARTVADDLYRMESTRWRDMPSHDHFRELIQTWHQLELVTPEGIRDQAEEVVGRAYESRQLAIDRALAVRVRERLTAAADRPDGGDEATAARSTLNRLEALRVASRNTSGGNQTEATQTSIREDLRQIPWLTEDEQELLLDDATMYEFRPHTAFDEMGLAVRSLLDEARRMLGADAE